MAPALRGALLTVVLASPSLAAISSTDERAGAELAGPPTVGAPPVTKKDIVKTIAEQLDLPQLRTRELVQRTFDALIETLVREGRVELRNFGVFQIKTREARMARNPRTGEQVPVQAKQVVTFKPGKEMEARVRDRPLDDDVLRAMDLDEARLDGTLQDLGDPDPNGDDRDGPDDIT